MSGSGSGIVRMIAAGGLIAGLVLLGAPATASAQDGTGGFWIEGRGGINAPTFDITDVADAGPSFGVGIGIPVTERVSLLADADFGFHGGAETPAGTDGPDVDVYHYIAKVGYDVLGVKRGPWRIMVNAGIGAMTFDVDGADSFTYPAINVGAKISYAVSERFAFVLSPQGDIAFSDEDEVTTDDSWVWPFAAGIQARF